MPVLKPHESLPEPEVLLLDYAERLTHHRAGRRVLCLALSALVPPTRNDEHWRIVDNLVQPLILRHGGEIFRLRSGDVVTVFTSADKALVERLTLKLRYLFRDDPLIEAEEKEPGGESRFCRWFDLNDDYDGFLGLARAIKEAAEDPTRPAALITDKPEPRPEPRESDGTGTLERWLLAPPKGPRALAALADGGAVAKVEAGRPAERAGAYFRAHLAGLTELGLSAADIERNAPIEAPLLAHVERRLLIELAAARRPAEQLTLALSLDAILSVEFLHFHKIWTAARFEPLTCLVARAEAEADPARFAYVRSFVTGAGHRLGLSAAASEPQPMPRTPIDVLALAFDARCTGPAGHALLQRLSPTLPPRAAVMLTGVDTRDALAFARNLGATLLAGRQADALVQSA